MAETTQPKTLSELKKQLSTQPTQTTLSQPKTLSELKKLIKEKDSEGLTEMIKERTCTGL